MRSSPSLPALAAVPAATSAPPIIERVFTCHELAEAWKVSVETIRLLFLHEPGGVVLSQPRRRGVRVYRTLRIPESVIRRVWTRMQNK